MFSEASYSYNQHKMTLKVVSQTPSHLLYDHDKEKFLKLSVKVLIKVGTFP